MSSTTLENHFKKKKNTWYFEELKASLSKLEYQISPFFIEQFNRYRNELLSLVSENVSTVEDPFVQEFIADKNRKIWDALSHTPELDYNGFLN